MPQEGDPARSTWAGSSAEHGGAPTWMTGTYDAETNTLFWTTGNPLPTYDGSVREGDNLYACSLLALDPKNGRLKWYFQFTPHDTHDWDANETPVLIDATWKGKARKLLIQANRNGFYYALDRMTGQFLFGKSYANQTWAFGLDGSGRPMVKPNTDPEPEGSYVCADAFGNSNWASPSYDRQTGLFYIAVREGCGTYRRQTRDPRLGEPYYGGDFRREKLAPLPQGSWALREESYSLPPTKGISSLWNQRQVNCCGNIRQATRFEVLQYPTVLMANSASPFLLIPHWSHSACSLMPL